MNCCDVRDEKYVSLSMCGVTTTFMCTHNSMCARIIYYMYSVFSMDARVTCWWDAFEATQHNNTRPTSWQIVHTIHSGYKYIDECIKKKQLTETKSTPQHQEHRAYLRYHGGCVSLDVWSRSLLCAFERCWSAHYSTKTPHWLHHQTDETTSHRLGLPGGCCLLDVAPKTSAATTLHYVLSTSSRCASPFVPQPSYILNGVRFSLLALTYHIHALCRTHQSACAFFPHSRHHIYTYIRRSHKSH